MCIRDSFGMVLALAPMLSPMIEHGRPAADDGARWPYLLAGLLLLVSFPVQHFLHERLGLGLRGLVAAAVLVLGAGLWRPSTAPGLHRRLYRLALILVPLG